jgi:hypothetical protein
MATMAVMEAPVGFWKAEIAKLWDRPRNRSHAGFYAEALQKKSLGLQHFSTKLVCCVKTRELQT